MEKWLIVWLVRTFTLENKKWFWVTFPNSNTSQVESFVRFQSMQKLFKFLLTLFKIFKRLEKNPKKDH
jgi:hypothetical protein